MQAMHTGDNAMLSPPPLQPHVCAASAIQAHMWDD